MDWLKQLLFFFLCKVVSMYTAWVEWLNVWAIDEMEWNLKKIFVVRSLYYPGSYLEGLRKTWKITRPGRIHGAFPPVFHMSSWLVDYLSTRLTVPSAGNIRTTWIVIVAKMGYWYGERNIKLSNMLKRNIADWSFPKSGPRCGRPTYRHGMKTISSQRVAFFLPFREVHTRITRFIHAVARLLDHSVPTRSPLATFRPYHAVHRRISMLHSIFLVQTSRIFKKSAASGI